MFLPLALAAVVLEALFGYPKQLARKVAHPVMVLGHLIARCDTHWNTPSRSEQARRLLGVLTLGIVVAVAAATAALLSTLATTLFNGTIAATALTIIVLGFAASTLIAARSLFEHVNAVAKALEHDGLEAARNSVALIVGRDTGELDEAGVARAAIESLAENFSDGVVTPVFWLALAGLPGIAAYKAINTSDSMIGHISDKYRAFGWASAKTDDLVVLPGTTIAAGLLQWAALIHPSASMFRAWDTWFRFSHLHKSRNAGHMESAMAGALGIALGGPRAYGGETLDEPWIGDGRKDVTPKDIRDALSLYRTACIVQACFLAFLSIPFWSQWL